MKLLNYTDEKIEDWTKLGIYKISYLNYHKNIVYIGQASKIGKKGCNSGFYYRWLTHIRDLETSRHHNKYLQRIVNKYGINNIRFSIIEYININSTVEQFNNKETYYIGKYLEDKNFTVLNSSAEARSFKGLKHTDETKLKMSKARKGRAQHINTYEALMKANIGRIKTEEEKQKLSKVHKGKVVSEETRKKQSKARKGLSLKDRRKVIAASPDLVLEFNSYIEASEYFNISKSHARALANKNKTFNNFTFNYIGETKQKNTHCIKPIDLFDNSIYIKTFPSINEVCDEFKLSKNSIRGRIKNNKVVIKNTKLILKYK